MVVLRILVFTTLLTLIGCHRYTPPILPEIRMIQVKVIDVESNDPIHGVKVSVRKNYIHKPYLPLASSVSLAEYFSDQSGEVHAPLSLKGSYTFEVGNIGSIKCFGRKIFNPDENKENQIIFKISRK